MFSAGIVTASDKCYENAREDLSGMKIKELIVPEGYSAVAYKIVPDEVHMIQEAIIYMCDDKKVDVVFTTGGTGFSQRDVTPEATELVIERKVPGISEAIRSYSMKITPKAMLSRGISGIRNHTLIINLPGSPKAVEESLEIILPVLKHGVEIMKGEAGECGR